MNKSVVITTLLLLAVMLGCKGNPIGPPVSSGVIYSKEYSPFSVTENGTAVEIPFLGGFNDPKPMLVDFDSDGLTDLMIGQIDGTLLYLKNSGSITQPEWTVAQDRLGGIDIGTWYTLCDIDADGDLDLFCDSRDNTIKFYRNKTHKIYRNRFSTSSIEFVLEDDELSSFVDTALVTLKTGLNNTPAFVDIDNDQDLDYFFGALSGKLEFHENIGTATVPEFEFVSDFYDSIIAFPTGPVSSKSAKHGFSFIRFADIDSDNDQDLFWGDIFNSNLYHFQNDGTPDTSALTLITQNYLPILTSGFNHPTFADLDNDQDLDMVLGVAQISEINSLRYLRNDGIDQAALFTEVTQNFISQLDFGTASMPEFADIDGDGDIDMLVGGSNGQIAYYQNTGSVLSPDFNRVTEMLSGIDVGTFSAPAIVDWDQDGDLDLLVGTAAGRIEYWRNDGSVTNFLPTLVTNQLAGIKIDQNAIPRPVDLNNDSLIDLVVGEFDFNIRANILVYKNDGSISTPNLVLESNKMIPIGIRDYTIPYFYDWNEDGMLDLILGGKQTELILYTNTAAVGQFPDSVTLILETTKLPGYKDGEGLSVRFVDIDGDGDDDVFIGERFGGINFYRRIQ